MKKLAVTLIAAALVLSLCSCGFVSMAYNAGREQGRREALAAAPQGPAVSRQPAGGPGYWQEIPDTIPAFGYGAYLADGAFVMEDRNGKDYHLDYAGVTRQDVDDYGKRLIDKGFEVSSMPRGDDYVVIALFIGDLANGPTVQVSLNEKTGDCSITVMTAK